MRLHFCLGLASMLAAGLVSNASAAPVPGGGPYIFTGTATILSGNSDCLGAPSPAAIAGDAIVASGGSGFDLHITSSAVTYAVAANFKTYSGFSPVQFGRTQTGSLSYFLLPSTVQHAGSFSALAERGTGGGFTDTITLTTGPLIGKPAGTCQIELTLTLTPGINKALLKLLKGVL
jgi:hypothetical protein